MAKPERTTLHVKIAKELDRELELKAVALDIPKRQLVEQAIRLWLSQAA